MYWARHVHANVGSEVPTARRLFAERMWQMQGFEAEEERRKDKKEMRARVDASDAVQESNPMDLRRKKGDFEEV